MLSLCCRCVFSVPTPVIAIGSWITDAGPRRARRRAIETFISMNCLRDSEPRLGTLDARFMYSCWNGRHGSGTITRHSFFCFPPSFQLLLELINFKATAISSISGDGVDAIKTGRRHRLQSRTYSEINQSITPRLQPLRDGVFRCERAFSHRQCLRQLCSSLAEVLITLMELLRIRPATSSSPLKQDGCLALRFGSHCGDNRCSVFILIKNSKINVYLSSCLSLSRSLSLCLSLFLSSCHAPGIVSQSLTRSSRKYTVGLGPGSCGKKKRSINK